MHLTPNKQDRFRILAILIIAAAGLTSVAAAAYLGINAGKRIHTELSERSQTVAAALDAATVGKLAGNPGDDGTDTYNLLKTRLAAIKQVNPDARSIYLMGRHDGRLFFFVDSEEPASQYYSSAGEAYDDGTQADHDAFDIGKPFVEGPATDEYGTFISGIAPIKDSQGRVEAALGIDFASAKYWRDITFAAAVPLLTGLTFIMIIVIFENIRRRNAQLLALRSELVSVASHELRTPVTGIRWAAESLEKMEGPDSKQMPMIQAIKHSATRLQESTDDILELTHAMNRRDLVQADTDLTALLHEVFEAQALSAQQKGVALHMDSMWPEQVIVRCDASQMRRVLHNVISNAIKYTQPNTAVTATYKQDTASHQISIADEGIGIPADEQDKVFRGFYRASNAVASKVPGTGLGLFLVQAVMKQHGGSVRFISAQDKGTTVELRLPKHASK